MMKTELLSLYKQTFGTDATSIVQLTGAGSNRQYFRLLGDGGSCIGAVGTSVAENRAFFTIAARMKSHDIHVPQVLAISADELSYLQSDLGSLSLYDKIAACHKTGTWDAETVDCLKNVMRTLPQIQFQVPEQWNFKECYPQSAFDGRTVHWDLNHFKYCFLKPAGLEFQESLLEDDFERLSAILLADPTDTFLYRDFQSRNIMVKDSIPYYIDFQGGRKGPIYYDVASFLWQARAAYPDDLREELLQCYLQSLSNYSDISSADFRKQLSYFVLFRMMQVLGAYGLRGLVEHKAAFVVTIPAALKALKKHLQQYDFSSIPYLKSVLLQLVDLPKFAVCESTDKTLTVKIASFSFKKGIPEDLSGNGGGFVFDCRAMNNPGRYEPYKQLTGLDAPVIKFLEDDGEIIQFMEHVYAIVDPAVKHYMDRGFTSLMVSFGCTGGQHRSVYGAQHLAEHLFTKYGVRVRLVHREQGIEQLFEK